MSALCIYNGLNPVFGHPFRQLIHGMSDKCLGRDKL